MTSCDNNQPVAAVVAVIATYGRPVELRRLLESLSKIPSGLLAAVVVDNANDEKIRSLVKEMSLRVEYVAPGRNLGCGGGLRVGEEVAMERFASELTHVWILDDDAVVEAETLQRLLETMEVEDADVSCPLVVAPNGRIGWVPGLRDRQLQRIGENSPAPDEYSRRFDRAAELVWAQGIALLVTRRALQEAGLHRDDFWVRGEDLEFSLRLCARFRGVLVPQAFVQHLPPPESGTISRESEYLKHCAMVQNNIYLALRLSHGRRVLYAIPGTLCRFLALWGWRACRDAALAFWRGGLCAEPAGRGSGATFLKRFTQLC